MYVCRLVNVLTKFYKNSFNSRNSDLELRALPFLFRKLAPSKIKHAFEPKKRARILRITKSYRHLFRTNSFQILKYPSSIDSTALHLRMFSIISGSHIKPKSMFCPHLHSSVCKMTEVLQQQREQIKHRVLYPPNTTQVNYND